MGKQHQVDVLDEHVDLKRRISQLEKTRFGRDAVQQLRSDHPYPIAEHLCSHSMMVDDTFPSGEVNRYLMSLELRETDLNIHRLLRVARERLFINRWIGNQMADNYYLRQGNMYLHPAGQSPYIGNDGAMNGRAPMQPGEVIYAQYGSWLYPYVNPGYPAFKKHNSVYPSVKYGGNNQWQAVSADDGSIGLIWMTPSIWWTAVFKGQYVSGLTPSMPEDAFSLGYFDVLTGVGYSRGASRFYDLVGSPPAMVLNHGIGFYDSNLQDQYEVDTYDGVLKSVPFQHVQNVARMQQPVYGLPNYLYGEDSQDFTDRMYYYPTDQLKAAGPPFRSAQGYIYYNQLGTSDPAKKKPFTAAKYADVVLGMYPLLDLPEFDALSLWYIKAFEEMPAGEWSDDPILQVTVPSRTPAEQRVEYDHRWQKIFPYLMDGTLIGYGQYTYDQQKYPQFSIANGTAEYCKRNGVVFLRGVAFNPMGGGNFQYLVDMNPSYNTSPLGLKPAYGQQITIIGASGKPTKAFIDQYGKLGFPGNEQFYYLDGAYYITDF